MAIEDFLDQSCEILAESPPGSEPAQDSFGGADRTAGAWLSVAGPGVPCLYRPQGMSLSAYAGRRNDARQQQIDGRAYFAADPTPGGITSKHRLIISGCPRASDDGTYSVVGAIDPNAMGRLLEVNVERIRGG